MVLKLNVKFVITLHLCSLYVYCVYRDDCWKSACIQHSLMAIQKYFEVADLYEFAHLYVLVLLWNQFLCIFPVIVRFGETILL